MKTKKWDGERLETFIYNETTIEHLHRYAIALDFIKGKRVLDIASGEGYGSYLMSATAAEVVGVDISEDAVNAARKKYTGRNNLSFKTGSADAMPVEDQSIDVVVSFETIEHHAKHEEMMQEIKRVLKPGGIMIMSSPDKLNYSDRKNYNNPYHLKELYEKEFKELVGKYFTHSCFFKQKACLCSLVIADTAQAGYSEYEGGYEHIGESNDHEPIFIIAIASDLNIPQEKIKHSIFKDNQLLYSMTAGIQNQYERSATYRIGKIMMSPVRLIRKIFK